MLQSSPVVSNGTVSGLADTPAAAAAAASPVQPGMDEVDAGKSTESNAEESTSKTKSGSPKVYSPFIRLMEITKNIKITDSK